MCGIAGMVGDPDPDLLFAMARVMAHRGPDDEGIWHDSMAGLASRRLKVIDLVGGHQPISNEDGSCWLAFNGEIYNHRDLHRQLESKGHRFASQSDSEVIVHLYEEEGESCLEKLEGMFALAIWDRPKRRLLLARDPLGIKPLYYREEGNRLWFASEAKALLLDPNYQNELDSNALAAFLSFLYIPSPQTAFKGIKKLCPGEALTFRNGSTRLHRYWRPPVVDQWISDPRDAAARVIEALEETINPNRKIFEARKRETAALGAGEKLVLGHPLAATIGDSARCMQNLEKVLFTGPKTSDTVTFICD